MWPDYLELLTREHRAVFLIDTSENEQAERLRVIRDSGSDHNWMRDFDDAKMATWAHFNALRSRRYQELCEKTGYAYFDVAGLGEEGTEQRAFEYLLRKTV